MLDADEVVVHSASHLRGIADGVAQGGGEIDVDGGVHLGTDTFKVLTVVEERLFGVVTHKSVHLVKHHGG